MTAVDTALADAERRGFRLAVLGRTVAVGAIAVFYLLTLPFAIGGPIVALVLAIGAVGLVPLALVGGPQERRARYAFFALDAAAIAAVIAFGPVSSAGGTPQNFVFLSDRQVYFYVVLAASLLTLSPGLVLWTGLWCAAGLAAATLWIAAHMERIVSYRDLPPAPSRQEYLAIALDPHFLNVPVRLSECLVLVLVTGVAALAVHRARTVVRAHAAAEDRRSRLQRLFGRYVPAQVAEQLAEAGHLTPEMREASVLFADIEGFTGLAERLPPARVIGLLNEFFGAATEVIDAHRGVVVNHVGDALIAAFNAPLPLPDYPVHAVEAARALQTMVGDRRFDGHRLQLRIGIATGPVAAGTVGGAERQTYTLYGDTVNLAQRLERLNKKYGTDCLICARTFAAARSNGLEARTVGTAPIRGRNAAVEAFALQRTLNHRPKGLSGDATRPPSARGPAGA